MLSKLLQPQVIKFIERQEKSNLKPTDIDRLLFNKSKYPNIPMKLVVDQLRARKKAENKLPEWFNTEGLIFSPLLSMEQCSSEQAAKYKASLVQGNLAIDLTGGTGVDAYYLSKIFREVIYVESNKDLVEIARHNFLTLGATNIEVVNAQSEDFISRSETKADLIYIDPARRDKDRKLFLLDDCSPNVLGLQELFFRKSKKVMLKASPMLDIEMGVSQLKQVQEVHIIAIKNEVKELLFIQTAEEVISIKIVATDLYDPTSVTTTMQKRAKPSYSKTCGYLYEPNSAILKSGKVDVLVFDLSPTVFKLHPNTHLFTSNELIEDFPGRVFKVDKVLKYDKKEIRKSMPSLKANIATRNFPDSVDEIRKKIGVKPGGSSYLFGVRERDGKAKVLLCSKI